MKEGTLMRVLFCKMQCPFICFCKPSAAHLYTSAPLKLESSPHSTFAVDKPSSGVEVEVEKKAETVLKSCIRKSQQGEEEAAGKKKKKVEWMDMVGKQLAEIKEFECCSEAGDTENEEDSCSRCVCIIL